MGVVIKNYFLFAREKGGVALTAKLAMRTCITSIIAEKVPDSPENVDKVRKSLQEILPGEVLPDLRA